MLTQIHPFSAAYPFRTAEWDGARIHLVGNIHGVADPMSAVLAATVVGGYLRDAESLRSVLRSLHGNFAIIVRDRIGQVLASADKVKSYPVFYARDAHGALHVAGSADALLPIAVPRGEHPPAFLEFAMAGYVTNGETLAAGIRQLRGGECLIAESDGAMRMLDWYQFWPSDTQRASRAARIEEFHAVTRDVFTRLAERLGGRTALIPLSGGYDSRLVLTALHATGYRPIRTFSYGIPGNCEAAAARVIAERVGVPWTFIPYTRAFGRAVYASPERAAYFAFVHQHATMPTMTDFYAFHALTRSSAIPADSIVINGQTGDFISGGHIPAACDAPTVDRRALLRAVTSKHYAFWRSFMTPENLAVMEARILASLPSATPAVMDREEAMRRYEYWEWRARQCEHVVPGQRAYDFFGLTWELPLWDDAYLTFWATLPFVEKYQQALYRAALAARDPYRIFQRPFRRYTPPLPLAVVSACLKVLGPRADEIRRTYLQYWQKYAYFYAMYPYREYRRFARDHRNANSCLSREVLAEMHHRSLDSFG